MKLKDLLKIVLSFVLYLVLAYVAMVPGYMSAVYWLLFPIIAAFLMTIPLTYVMNMKKVGTTLLLPLLLFILSKLMGELGFTVCWIPYLVVIVIAEVVRDVIGVDKPLSMRVAAPITMLSMAMWNNGFYFGGEAYRLAAIEDMGEAYVASAYSMNTATTYIIVLAGVIVLSIVSERLTEKFIMKK